MESIENSVKPNKVNQSRNNVISIKVSNSEKEKLQQISDDVDLTVSEFLRLKGLSTKSSIIDYEQGLNNKDEEIKNLKIDLAFYEGNKFGTPGIALPFTEFQAYHLLEIFRNYYDDNTPPEQQLIRYLIEDLFTPHYQFEKDSIIDMEFKTHSFIKPVKVEMPLDNSKYSNDFVQAFQNIVPIDFKDKVLNQIKSPNNNRIISEPWKQSQE